MRIEELLKLVDAGFTKNEILTLSKTETKQEEPEEKNEPETKQEEPAKIPATPEYKEILAAIEKLTGAVITNNINNSDVPAPKTGNDAENVLAQILGGNNK